MASTKISELTRFTGGADLAGNDLMPVVDQSASETKALSINFLAAALPALFADGSIPTAKVNLNLPDGSVETTDLQNGCVTAAKLAGNSTLLAGDGVPGFNGNYVGQQYFDVTGRALYRWESGSSWSRMLSAAVDDNSITAAKLADSSTLLVGDAAPVVTGQYSGQLYFDAAAVALYRWDATTASWVVMVRSEIADGSVTAAKLADNSTFTAGDGAPVTDGLYSGYLYFDGTGRVLYQWNGATWSEVLRQGLADGSVTAAKLADSSSALVSSNPPAADTLGIFIGQLWLDTTAQAVYVWTGSEWIVATDKTIAEKSITASLLANNATTVSATGALPDGAYTGQLGYQLDTGKLFVWSGTEWLDTYASQSVNAINYGVGIVELTIVKEGDVVTIDTNMADTTAPAQVLAGPTATGGVAGYRALVGGDLPAAEASNRGAVRVSGEGLRMDIDQIEIDNDITPVADTFYVCELNAKGLVVNFREIQPEDLPIATATSVGVIQPGTDFEVDSAGVLGLETKVIPGTYTKVGVEASGLISSVANLEEGDIPGLDASILESGFINIARIEDESLTSPKFADYATCFMQEGSPGEGEFLGMMWYQPSTAQLRIYARGSAGNQWLPVGFGALQANNLRWGGSYDASTDKITVLTDIGISEGLESGSTFPAASAALSGLYFICQTAGNGMTQSALNNINHTPGDWALCVDEKQGWLHIDTNAGGGGGSGGGGASYLNDLLDVDVAELKASELLKYDSSTGVWKNNATIDGGSID
jgi:hypothetical protein